MAQTDDLTASGVTLGTFDYISPEQARDPRSADVRSDLYSLGCSFFYMLTGRPPFPDGTVLQKLLQHQGDHPPDPRSVRPELPQEVTWILARLLAKNPAQRYQRPAELTAELAALGEKLGLNLGSSHPVYVPPPPTPLAAWSHHLPWIVPLAALFAIVLLLDLYWSEGRADRPSQRAAVAKTIAAPAKSNAVDADRQGTTKPAAPVAPLPKPVGDSSDSGSGPARPTATKSLPTAPGEGQPQDTDSSIDSRRPNAPLVQRLLKSWTGNLDFQAWASRVAKANRATTPPPDRRRRRGRCHACRAAAGVSRPLAARDKLLIVGEGGAGTYANLLAAVSNAKSGDVIELRFNGPRHEKPITIANTRLTIRAGADYQPLVVFRPEPTDALKYPQSMVIVAGGQLSVVGVHWELDLPRNVPADWALFETRHAESLQFKRSTFTVRNSTSGRAAYHAGVAFFDIKAPPGAGTMAMDPVAGEEQIVTISLEHCVARGEATFLRDNDLQAVRVNWDDGLLATSERLLVAAGGASQSKPLGRVQINLRHLTCMVQSGLVLLTNREDAPYQLTDRDQLQRQHHRLDRPAAAGRAARQRLDRGVPGATRVERRPRLLRRL